MQTILKFKYAIVLLCAFNCVLLCSAQGGNGGWGGSSGGNGGWGGSSGGNGAPGAPGGGSGRGAPGASGGDYYGNNDHVYSAAANISLSHLPWIMILMPFTYLLKYVRNE